ncbi:MAG: MATE family efflux transporter [Ruminococcaceae bacterium]|nr:MATE family efflux transporter [Oscillospiraceae bacterium]
MISVIRKRLGGSKRDVDMTEGNIFGHIIKFAIPLLLGNLLQQLYNMVDTWVVGNYVGSEAFSAVGTVGPIINMLISLFWGFSAGAGVVVSQYYGAKKYDKVSETVHTTLLVTVILGIVLTGVGIALVPTMLDLMNTPTELLDEATEYLTVYFSGLIGLVVYNIGSGILRAVGDSRRPFYFLAVSALTNTVLDLVFVLAFNMGVKGVALATIIAQGLSAVLILITLCRSDNCIKVSFGKLKIHKDELFKIIKVGLPVALQMIVTSFSNVFVQAYINYFGANAMGGWTAYAKIDQLILLPMQSIALASTTFVGQNLGNDDVKRAKKGVNASLLLAVSVTVLIMIPILIFAPQLVYFFNKDGEIISYGAIFLRTLTPFYVLCCVNQIYAGALRGSGNATAPMIIMLVSFVGFRQLYLYVMATFISNTPIPIALSYPAGWLVCSAVMFIYYKTVKLEKGRIVK